MRSYGYAYCWMSKVDSGKGFAEAENEQQRASQDVDIAMDIARPATVSATASRHSHCSIASRYLQVDGFVYEYDHFIPLYKIRWINRSVF